jgi:hypothetical protein
MRLAWFHPATHVSERFDDTPAIVAALRAEHDVELIDQTRAHEFIRLDFRNPFDLCVFELADAPEYAFVWPYLLHVPGVLRLRSPSLHRSRVAALRHQRRMNHVALERALGADLAGAPVLASRLTVVSDEHAAARLQREFPAARVRHVPLGMGVRLGSDPGDRSSPGSDPLHKSTQPLESGREGGLTLVGSVDQSRAHTIRQAVARARQVGARIELMDDARADRVLDEADVVLALSWPQADEPMPAIAAMAARRAVVVIETERTAGWPALDPQTWQPRGWSSDPPIVVAIDPRDEEHSLYLALQRLSADATLRDQLGTAAHNWAQRHAARADAIAAWQSIVTEAVTLAPPPAPSNWPPHLRADGTERARQILGEFATSVDVLD